MAFVGGGLVLRGKGMKTSSCSRSQAVSMSSEWSSGGGGGYGEGSQSGGHLEKIEFIIRPGGRVEQKVIGVKGSKCVEITKAIEKSLGKVVHDEKTEEYFETPNEQQLGLEVKEDIPTW
uniref:Uncharacterized protein n=1 Tax=Rhodosorus marinus TaxID=101924 RepID=A0A7S0BJ64_9RHOD|mmetsp:Transcript_19154/g.27773  ORF Transcript_19154/g.27773 Transcript_19154/m.27773 type:complete len:119 (+) Transcript_19154:449-805(+)